MKWKPTNGWQRIGIVLTIGWAIGAFVYGVQIEVAHTNSMAETAFNICDEHEKRPYNDCMDAWRKAYWQSQEAWHQTFWTSPKIVNAYAFPLMGWFWAYLIIGIVKYVYRGFKPRTAP